MSTVGRPVRTTASPAALVRDRARETPDRIAVRYKRHGIWREVTCAQYWHDIEQAAQVLLHLGVGPGDRVAILSENRYEWLILDAATVAVRGVTVGIDPTATPAQVGAALAASHAVVAIAEDAEQVDRVLAGDDRSRGLAHLLCLDARGIRGGDADARLRSWATALERRAVAAEDVRRRMDEAGPEDAVALFGRPGAPAVAVSAGEVARDVAALLDGGIAPSPSDRDSVLPLFGLADRGERLLTSWLSAAAGVQVHVAESVSTVPGDLREVQPTLVYAPAPMWERLAADIDHRMAGASRLKRLVWRRWRPTAGMRAWETMGRLVLYRPLRDRIGLRRVRHAASDNSVAAEVRAFFAGIGVPLHPIAEVTGASESEPAGGEETLWSD